MSTHDEARISVVINTLNEEKNLPYALRSVWEWAEEIIVVDMYSDDNTSKIARDYGAHVYMHERMGFSEPARQFAVDKASQEWVFILDADELVPLPLSEALKQIVTSNSVDIVNIPRRNYLLGDVLHRTGWGEMQDKQMRFFRKSKMGFSDRIHGYIKPNDDAVVQTLSSANGVYLVHFNYLDESHFIQKLNKYTSVEATQTSSSKSIIWCAFKAFLIRFILRGGYKDGWRGYHLSILMALYAALTQMKFIERIRVGSRQGVEAYYKLEAERYLGEYNHSQDENAD